MPPATLFDLSTLDLDAVAYDQEAIRGINPQRGDMEHLDCVVWQCGDKILGYKDVRENEFWVPGHIPGRPILPGVIMLEAAAQLASLHTHTHVGWEGFIGFGGLENVKFRAAVQPGKRLWLLANLTEVRNRRIKADMQGVVDGNIVFEAVVIGTKM